MKLRTSRGVTLIELMVALALGFILIMFAIPSYNTWTADAETASAASALADAMRSANAEAIKQNTAVELTLTSPGWTARYVTTGDPIGVGRYQEGAYRASGVGYPGGTSKITFNSLGGVEPKNEDTTDPFQYVEFSVPSGSRPLRVYRGINSTGIRVCDPKFAWPADPKGCP
jgi:prepilin-type N-terminal cleavage/methylation domain-containing protein